jgi:phosphohistidine phosphatase SixA
MGILLVRHADAVEGGGDVDDAARWLSLAGRARALASAHKLRDKGLQIRPLSRQPARARRADRRAVRPRARL